jgi:hypothetical protein
MSGNGAMTQEELDHWTADVFQGEHGPGSGGGGGGEALLPMAKPEPFWIAVFIVLGVGSAGLFVWLMWYLLKKCVDDDLGAVTSEDIRLHYSNKHSSRGGGGGGDGGGGGGLIDDMSGKCAVCREKQKDGKGWRTSGYGGCGYLVCNDCHANYRPLAERCVACGQFYCYRRGWVTFSDLERDNEQPVRSASGRAAVKARWGEEGRDEQGEDGLRRRNNS